MSWWIWLLLYVVLGGIVCFVGAKSMAKDRKAKNRRLDGDDLVGLLICFWVMWPVGLGLVACLAFKEFVIDKLLANLVKKLLNWLNK